MKRYGAVIALGLAVAFGAVAVVLANQWLAAQASVESTGVQISAAPSVKIVVAAQDIGVGSRLSENNLVLSEWPKNNVPKGAFTDIAAVAERIAVTKLVTGEPVLAAELAAPGSGAGLVALIEPGMRAMAIKVDEVTGVGGFILPSTYVDVIGVEKTDSKTQKASTILKKIKVLAIAQETFTEEGKAQIVRTVTFEVKPEQAEKLALQTHKGSIHLVLRNPLEEEEQEKPAPPVKRVARKYTPKPTPPPPFNVEVIRGTDREQIKFKNVKSDENY